MSAKQPASENELEAIIRRVHAHAQRDQFDEALELCDALIANATTQQSGYRERAEVRLAMKLPELAISDLKTLIDLDSAEPADYFNLGIGLLKVGQLNEAISAFSEAIEIGEKENFHYYTNSSRMHLVETYLRKGMLSEAEADCQKIPAGYSSFLPSSGVQTKEQMVERIHMQQAARAKRGK